MNDWYYNFLALKSSPSSTCAAGSTWNWGEGGFKLVDSRPRPWWTWRVSLSPSVWHYPPPPPSYFPHTKVRDFTPSLRTGGSISACPARPPHAGPPWTWSSFRPPKIWMSPVLRSPATSHPTPYPQPTSPIPLLHWGPAVPVYLGKSQIPRDYRRWKPRDQKLNHTAFHLYFLRDKTREFSENLVITTLGPCSTRISGQVSNT